MQQINLFQPDRYTPPRLAAANALFAALGLAIGAVALYYVATFWQFQEAQHALMQRQTQRTTLTDRRDALSEQLRQMKPSVALESEAGRLANDLAAKRTVLRLLTGDAAGNRAGFSGHLEGLARRPLKGLWLTGISIQSGGRELDLRGNALAAELVPSFVERLREEAAFVGQEFAMLQMQRPATDSPAIEFQLRTIAADGKANE